MFKSVAILVVIVVALRVRADYDMWNGVFGTVADALGGVKNAASNVADDAEQAVAQRWVNRLTDDDLIREAIERGLSLSVAETMNDTQLTQLLNSRDDVVEFVVLKQVPRVLGYLSTGSVVEVMSQRQDFAMHYLVVCAHNYPAYAAIVFSLLIVGAIVCGLWFFRALLFIGKKFWAASVWTAAWLTAAGNDFVAQPLSASTSTETLAPVEMAHLVLPITDEAVVPGQPLVQCSPANCQVYIAAVDPACRSQYVGSGFRVKDQIFTARHVIDTVPTDSEIYLFGRDQSTSILVGRGKWHTSDNLDFAWADVPNNDLSRLQVASATIPRVLLPKGSTQFVTVSNAKNSSTSALITGPEIGDLVYRGSTTAGFSGAPYYNGKTVYGMHLGHGPSNFGLDVFLLAAIARTGRAAVVNESSGDTWDAEDFLADARSGAKFSYRLLGADDVVVFSDQRKGKWNRFHLQHDPELFFDIIDVVEGRYPKMELPIRESAPVVSVPVALESSPPAITLEEISAFIETSVLSTVTGMYDRISNELLVKMAANIQPPTPVPAARVVPPKPAPLVLESAVNDLLSGLEEQQHLYAPVTFLDQPSLPAPPTSTSTVSVAKPVASLDTLVKPSTLSSALGSMMMEALAGRGLIAVQKESASPTTSTGLKRSKKVWKSPPRLPATQQSSTQ